MMRLKDLSVSYYIDIVMFREKLPPKPSRQLVRESQRQKRVQIAQASQGLQSLGEDYRRRFNQGLRDYGTFFDALGVSAAGETPPIVFLRGSDKAGEPIAVTGRIVAENRRGKRVHAAWAPAFRTIVEVRYQESGSVRMLGEEALRTRSRARPDGVAFPAVNKWSLLEFNAAKAKLDEMLPQARQTLAMVVRFATDTQLNPDIAPVLRAALPAEEIAACCAVPTLESSVMTTGLHEAVSLLQL